MNKFELFDLLFDSNSKLEAYYQEDIADKKVSGGEIKFVDSDNNDLISISNKTVYCCDCVREIKPINCEKIADNKLKLNCPECGMDLIILFKNLKKIPFSDKVKNIIEGSYYLVKVGDVNKHVLYQKDNFYSIEDNDIIVKPTFIIEEVFLTNTEIANLKNNA